MPIKAELPIINDLDKWEIVDDLCGKRWLGKVIETTVLPNGLERMKLEYAIEVVAASRFPLLIPQVQEDPRALLRGQHGAQQMSFAIQWVQDDGSTASTPMAMALLPIWEVTRVGGCKVEVLPGYWRDVLLKFVQQLVKSVGKQIDMMNEAAVNERRAALGIAER